MKLSKTKDDKMRARLAAIVEGSDDAIISKTLKGIITSWNPAAKRLFGYSAKEAIGRSVLMLFPSDRVKEEAGILARLRRGERTKHFETVRIKKNRERIEVSVTFSPLRDSRGTLIGASKIVRDITERKEAERALCKLQRSEAQLQTLAHWAVQAHEDERARLARAFHDKITQMLCAIQIRAHSLVEKLPARAGSVKREAIKLRKLVSKAALEMERISQNLRRGVFDTLGLVAALREIGAAFADRTCMSFTFACMPFTVRPPIKVGLSFFRIFQLALNNVEEHATARHVTVCLKQTPGFLQLTIKDDGIGFNPDAPANGKGISGVCLLRMRERAQYVGGALTVKSTRNFGTEIEVRVRR